MVITNTITISEVETLKTKTGVFMHHNRASFSRIIGGKMHHYDVEDCTMKIATNVSRMDDNMFLLLCAVACDSTGD